MSRYDFNKMIAKQSEEYKSAHDMLEEALDGQVYIKETFHKVNTNQVTGEALKKVSVGGKGGFGSQGDARDQEKQVQATSRVMVLSGPSQEAFDRNALLEQTVIGFTEDLKPKYMYLGDTHVQRIYNPSHLFGEKDVKGWIEISKTLGRDYDEFVHSNQLDPSDAHRFIEFMHKENIFGEKLEIDIDRVRAQYDELCGYRGAWKYVGIDGAEHRRYRFTVANYLNISAKKGRVVYVPKLGYMTWEASSYNHNTTAYEIYTKYYNETKSEEWLNEQMLNLDRKDCVQFLNWQLGEPQQENLMGDQQMRFGLLAVNILKLFLRDNSAQELKDKADRYERAKRLAIMQGVEESKIAYVPKKPKKGEKIDVENIQYEAWTTKRVWSDIRTVYNWELTAKGKIKTFEK